MLRNTKEKEKSKVIKVIQYDLEKSAQQLHVWRRVEKHEETILAQYSQCSQNKGIDACTLAHTGAPMPAHPHLLCARHCSVCFPTDL